MKNIFEKDISLLILPKSFASLTKRLSKHSLLIVTLVLVFLSALSFEIYYINKLGLSYNDARSHLDIGRRVVEGLKPGLAQIGSVWLPLNHILMIPLIWNDFMWHSGLAGAMWSMISYVATGILIFKFLERLNVGLLGRIVAVFMFATNINILYLQSTAMTELLLLATMMAGVYYLVAWAKSNKLTSLIASAFWIMTSTMVRYDGWFLLLFATALIAIQVWRTGGYKKTEGVIILFLTMGAFGIALWFLWNLLIFKDPLYFIFGPFSAHAQQLQLEAAGNLSTKGNFWLSIKAYFLSLFYNSYTVPAILGFAGAALMFFDKKIKRNIRLMSISLLAPLLFNILALYFGFSVLFVQGISGNSWFNVRYGIMLYPAFAIFVGYLVDRSKNLKYIIIGMILMITFFAYTNQDAVTIDDATVGASQKNVSEVSGWLNENTKNEKGFILISAASHDAIIFSSNLPMKKFIHEGTGKYWEEATSNPSKWARWIIVRTYDDNDLTWHKIETSQWDKYNLVHHFPFADIYSLKDEYMEGLITDPIYPNQK